MQKTDITSYILDGKIYHLDEQGNFYDEIITTENLEGLGFLKDFGSKIKGAFENVKTGVQNLFNRNNDKPEEEKQSILDRIRNGSGEVAKISSNVNTLLENEQAPGLNPNKTGVVQSGADANEANKVYQNAFNQAGMSFDFNNKWVMIAGGLAVVGVVFYVANSNKKKATVSKNKGLSGAGKRDYLVTYMLKKGKKGQQKTTVNASNQSEALNKAKKQDPTGMFFKVNRK